MQQKSEKQPEAGKQQLKAAKDTKAHTATRNDQLTDKLAASPIQEEIEESISYDEDFEVDENKKEETKEAVKQKKNDIEAVREYEKRKAQTGSNFVEEEINNSDTNTRLNTLWERIRDCFFRHEQNNSTNGSRIATESPLQRFEQFCADKQKKYKDQDTIKLDDIVGAFAAIRLVPMMTNSEFTELFTALEVIQDKEAGTILWNEILLALHNRSAVCYRGIFPKIKPREPTKLETEDKKRREDEAKREKENQQKELQDKIEDEQKRISTWEQKNAALAAKTKTKPKEMGKEEAKRLEKEKAGLEELKKAQQAIKDKEELEICKKEALEFTEVLTRVRNKFEQAGGELPLMNTFKTYDTDNDGLLTSQEFLKSLTRSKIFVKKEDIDAIYNMIDEERRDNISYREITDVLYGRKHLDTINLIKQQRIKDGRATGLTEDEIKATEKVSAQPTADSAALTGPFSDMTSVQRRSDIDKPDRPKFIDDSEHEKNQQEIKEAFLLKAYGFEDLCSNMGLVKPGNQGKITFEDFNKAVSHYLPGRFSSYQIKFVFQNNAIYAEGAERSEVEKAHIPVTLFKDLFYPQSSAFEPEYKKEIDQMKEAEDKKEVSNTSDIITESMQVSQIMQGLTREDLDAINVQRDKEKLIQENKALMAARAANINEEFSRTESEYSVAIDRAINARSRDPKEMKEAQEISKQSRKKEISRSERSELENQEYYRQKETQYTVKQAYGQKNFDMSITNLMTETAEALAADLQVSSSVKGKKRTVQPQIRPETYVERYGKEFPGFITFNEFKEIFMTHVYYADEVVQKKPPPQENKLKVLFSAIDTQNRSRISRDDFAGFVLNKRPTGNFLDKLRNKIMKGKDRFTQAITLEMNQADKIFGSHGLLPLPVFQTIMIDYGLPLMETDKPALFKEGILTTDKDKQQLIHYKVLLRFVAPQKNMYSGPEVLSMVIRIQKVVRGYLDRRRVKLLKDEKFKEIGEDLKTVGSKKMDASKAKKASDDKDKAEAQKRKTMKNSKEEMAKKKEAQLQQQRLARRNGQNIDTKMAGVVKTQRDARNDRAIKQRAEIELYIKETIIQAMINKAHAYGESLSVCREIQKNFANRPVTKYIYPLLLQFQFNVAGVQPKSLQAMNSLGQIMFLNNSNMLQQYDIATTKQLQSVNLGTKPPLKHYDIIDMVCDQRSGRIYTLNANWILEIWNIEQNTTFPQKRIAVCSNEGGKDYIGLYYRQTFQNSKPRFLSLQESNQQILVVNTSCVDGSIVFIDPISFSVLKKIQLRYQDYEIPKPIKQAINHLKEVLQQVQEKKGTDTAAIFAEIVDPEKQTIEIKKFVAKITSLDPSLDNPTLFKTCWALDRDNSGHIYLDDFITLTEQVAQEEEESSQAKADQELQDAIWPEWVIKEGKMEHAQNLLAKMQKQLEQKFSEISAEQVFSLYDAREKGFISKEQFQRIIKIFFEGILDEKRGDLDFLLRLTVMTTDQKIQYREFCRFLNKRLIRSFKHVVDDDVYDKVEEQASNKKKSALDIELERPIRKEASLNYILKKAASLEIDLRKEFIRKDPLELSVLSRVQFWNVIITQPLGLNEDELNEVFDNDLNFDNYGNVDYTSILNSDIFVKLEVKRIQEKALKSLKRKEKSVRMEEDEQENDLKAADNRKVVVEDLIFIEDLELIIYSTIAPKTSNVFITSLKKSSKPQSNDETPYLDVAQIGQISSDELQQQTAQNISKKAQKQETMTNRYQLIAKLKGHKNAEPPTICFIPQTGCLISGEKHIVGDHYQMTGPAAQTGLDPSVPPTSQGIKESTSTYDKFSQRHTKFNQKCEIFVWNLQRDMIELFSINPPWHVPAHFKFVAHDDSIIDICYLSKAQLLVTSSVDQTIRFWDPISVSYELTDPANNPHVLMKPGYYTPLKKEATKSNVTFKEVKRIYTGQDTSCFALRQMIIQDISLNSQCPEIKSQIEWLVALKMPKISAFEKQNGGKSLQMGFICGYGIERVKIEVPALHHDDIVPPYIIKECEEMISIRRKQLVTAFQTMLPFKIEKIYSQVQLQNSNMEKIRSLFMQAILNRKDGKYVNPIPLREIYNIIIKLPTRTKFESFLASTGCADKLSVSETFFYLQKFMQIHPLRTTQIEFEKSIEDFYQRHQRQFLRGIKRWPKSQIQKFANYIRQYGLNVSFLQEPSETSTNTEQAKVLLKFCTRERFIHYFMTEVKEKGIDFSQQEIEVILDELDPYYTGVIQISSIQRYYSEEIGYFKTVSLNRPNEVIEQIRSVAFPGKKIALQQALAASDSQGDGYIDQEQFIGAFYLAKVNVSRENLEFLFEVMSEVFVRGTPDDTPSNEPLSKAEIMAKQQAEKRFLNLDFFYRKLFQRNERREVTEVDETLSLIKASLIYKGVDFSIIFAEFTEETETKKGAKTKAKAKKTSDEKVDMMCHYTRFAQQLMKNEFCERLGQLKAANVTDDRIRRLANYLSLNQKNQSIIYLNSWLHHLRRVQTAFNVPERSVLPIICAKLLNNEVIFRSWVDTICQFKQKREEDKFIEQADLRQVLQKFGVHYINQNLFLNEFTRGPVHIDDLITLMKRCISSMYASGESDIQTTFGHNSLDAVKTTDFFARISKMILKHAKSIDRYALLEKFREFDSADTGMIKASFLVQVLSNNFPQMFKQSDLIGLQFELECLSYDQQVDYSEFVDIFFKPQEGTDGPTTQADELRLPLKKTSYTLQDYEDLLSRISAHVKKDDLPIENVFRIYWKQSGFITYENLRQILTILEFPITEKEFDILILYADENNQQSIHAHELVQQIINAEQVVPQFDLFKWIQAAREINSKVALLEQLQLVLPQINEQIETQQSIDVVSKDDGQTNKQAPQIKKVSKVITGDQFQSLLRREIPQMSEPSIELVTRFAIRGSKRMAVKGEKITSLAIDLETDLIQFKHLEMALGDVVQDLKKEEIKRMQQEQEALISLDDAEMLRKDFEKKERDRIAREKREMDPGRQKRESQLVQKITDIFRQRDVSFYDAFQDIYDPLKTENIITISKFKEYIKSLNLPLTVQDHRILRRMADPKAIGQVNINNICERFDTVDLRKLRLNKVLDQVATAFFIQNFNLNKAFQLFDQNGDGLISRRELREALNTLKLGLKYSEIDDIISMMSTRKDGLISYDDFIHKMDANIRHRHHIINNSVEEALFKKINDCLQYSGETLFSALQSADYDESGSILKEDLSRVFKRIGLSTIEPNLPRIMEIGGVTPSQEKIDIKSFSQKFMRALDGKIKSIEFEKKMFIHKIHSLIKAKEFSLFDVFIRMDVNQNGSLTMIELKTGIQALGIAISNTEMQTLWKSIKTHKGNENKPLNAKTTTTKDQSFSEKNRDTESVCTYLDFINTFVSAGCMKYDKSTDHSDILLTKYRMQLQRQNLDAEKAYKAYDPKDIRFVFRHDFIDTCMALQLEFSEDEFSKIFDIICASNIKNEGKADVSEKDKKSNQTRFTFMQFKDAITVKQDENWIFQAFIKIHSVVLQKSLTYKRLFTQWKDSKKSKAAAGRLTSAELAAGLKKLQAGLTNAEISRIVENLPYDGKDLAIGFKEFEEKVKSGSQKLEHEQSFERLLLVDWIMQFNDMMDRNNFPFDKLFREHDSSHAGGLSFPDFIRLNEFLGVSLAKKDLHRIFEIIDKDRSGTISLDEIKNISNLTWKQTEEEGTADSWLEEEEGLKGNDILVRQQLLDLYDDVKAKLEHKNCTLDQIFFTELQFSPHALCTVKGLSAAMEKLGIVVAQSQAERILKDLRKTHNNKFECTYKDFVDYMTRRRINVAFLEKGFIDPLLASCTSALVGVMEQYNIDHKSLFKVLSGKIQAKATVSKEDFVTCVQAMDLKLSVDDISEFFNHCDIQALNRITMEQFVTAIQFIQQRIGGLSALELQITKGASTTKKGQTNVAQVLQVIKNVCEGIASKKLSIRQLAMAMDINGTGFISRPEFVATCQQLNEYTTLDQIRILAAFLDDKNVGKISINEFLRMCTETLNSQIGGGMSAFMQVQPIIEKIVNDLSIDCDRFFDEIADANQKFIENQQLERDRLRQRNSASIQGMASPVVIPRKMAENDISSQIGLSKSVFFKYLSQYGVILKEHEKALISTVFGINDGDRDKLNYNLIDSAFEGIQQNLYAKESQFTADWQRRIYRKIGTYLMQNNKSIAQCFEFLDVSGTQTIQIPALKSALIRFQLNLSDKELDVFCGRIDSLKKGYVSKKEFISKFWAAYTYEEVFLEEEKTEKSKELASQKIDVPHINVNLSHNIVEASKKLKSELEDKVKLVKMFSSIQRKIKLTMSVEKAFMKLDTLKNGYLSLRDFHLNFSNFFDLSLREDEIRTLFQEIDTDHSGILHYEEFENFYNKNYREVLKQLEVEREQKNTQNEIFDHIIKVLKQRGLTLQDVFEEIDVDKNNYIDVEEFHNLLERMGFTITQTQVNDLMSRLDENFDGRISYHELRKHIEKLGFDIGSLENDEGTKKLDVDHEEFMWRDKAVELIIRTLQNKVGKKMTFDQYFGKYDEDHDAHLSPPEFRKSLLDLKEPQLKPNQIERIMHILLEEKKLLPLISLERIGKFFSNYKYLEINDGGNSSSVLIDEDLFCYIVEKYDGISRMMELSLAANDKSSYISRHIYEINSRGLNMLSNQKTVQILGKKTNCLSNLYSSTMILLAGEVNRLIKEEAQMCMLDPTYNIDTIVSDQNIGVLTSVSLPTIENSSYDIDQTTVQQLPCGAQQFFGKLVTTREQVEVLLYPADILQYVSLDGKSYKAHLAMELQVHRYIMGARFEEEDEFTPEEQERMDIVMNIGKFEKRIGLSMNEKEVYVINKKIDDDNWINLEDFVHNNGGILNIPLFYHTDAPLFIIRHWAKMILQIIAKVHDVSIVLRCLSTKQLWISRDGQRIKLGHTRGVGRVNNLGFIMACPDIYLNLENNEAGQSEHQSSRFSPSKGQASSSRKTEGQRKFSNAALDDAFLAPEMLFNKFQDHTAAIDVWAFGMIIYCVLFGKRPASYYKVYREWFKKSHNADVEIQNLPFIPPSQRNFIYDPFSIDFEMPFDKVDYEELMGRHIKQADETELSFGSQTDKGLNDDFNFENFMKCIKNLSYSSMFSEGNSKKFMFRSLGDVDQCKEHINQLPFNEPPRFPGQETKASDIRKKALNSLAQATVLARKNELGLILDLISSCLDADPKKRPSIQGLLHSPIFKMDNHEQTNAVRFSQNVILYRSPVSSVSLRITDPLRVICEQAISNPMSLFERQEIILKLFAYTEDCINHISSMPIDEINQVLTENEKRKGILESTLRTNFKDKNYSQMRVSPNSPLASQVIEDKIIDMLIFITLRYMKNFKQWKNKKLKEIEVLTQTLQNFDNTSATKSNPSKSQGFEGNDKLQENVDQKLKVNRQQLLKKQTERLQNHVLGRMSNLLKLMVYEMHSYSTPLAPYVEDVIRYIVKFFLGEEADFGSDVVLRKTSGAETGLQEYLRSRSFFRRENELNESFESDRCDKLWTLEQKNLQFLDKSNYWCLELHKEALKIFKDAITESGMGQSCYPVINDYIQNVSNSFEPTKIFSKQMNQLSLSFLIPMHRTAAYYNELIPLTESLSRLYDENLEKAGKRCSLAMIRSVFQTGNSDKIKACLDLRIPKHIIHFLQDSDAEIRKECLLILLEISKGLQDEDFEIISKNAVNMKQEFSKHGFSRTAFDKHKAMSMAAQQEVLDPGKIEISTHGARRGKQAKQKEVEESQTDQMCNFIKRTIALIEKNENERYINFALDLPNLNFLSSKRFLREMAIAFESPVFIAPLIRLLKNPEGIELHSNKILILEVIQNLICGNERVLIAINSPACDTYMTLLKMLMQSTKMQNARSDLQSQSAKMRYQIQLQDKAIGFFRFVFEQQRPTIIRDIKCIGAASTLLKEQRMSIPDLVNLPELMEFFDTESQKTNIVAKSIDIELYVDQVKQLRCWIKHFYKQSTIPELTRIKALQRCMNFLIRVTKLAIKEFFEQAITSDSPTKKKTDSELEERRDYKELIKTNLSLFDWVCVQKKMNLLFNEECGSTNLDFVIKTCNLILSQFRKPIGSDNKMPTMEDLTFNDKVNKKVQNKRKYEIFPMTDLGSILQNIQYQLVRANDPFINQLLSEANFGFVFGEQLLLEFDFVRHCIDNCVESMVLIDSYVKKNEIRLNTFEYLLRSHEHTLKDQFIKSNFCERLFMDYIGDFREFNIQFSKIDLEFLAFRRSFPLRLEAISILNTALMLKQNAPQIYTEMLMYARRHFLVRSEMNLLQHGGMTNREATSLLLFAIIVESNEEDLIYVMVQEGVHRHIRNLMKDYPSLNKRFPVLAQLINRF